MAYAEGPAANEAPISSGAPAANVMSPAAVPAAGLPTVITEKGASTVPLGEVTPAPALGKEATPPGSAKDGAMVGEAAQSGAAEAGEASAVEKSMAADETTAMKPQPFQIGKLTQFGYSFFKKSTAFAPVVDVPVGPDYIIGPGDILLLTAWGSLEGTFSLEVNRSGEITLPKVGAVRVWGVTFGKVPDVIRSAISSAFRNPQINVTMGKLRLIKVYIIGEVESPGDYNISALSTVINALAAAGGPTKNGTLRAIQVMRGGQVAETVDLYDFFLKGEKSRDIRLQSGDTVYVPIIGSVAGIGGNVKRPGIYELKNEKTLKYLIELGGGLNSSGYLNRIQLSRVEAHDKKIVADFNLEPKLSGKDIEALTAGVAIQDLDVVKVFPIDFTVRDHVRLDGYVLRPGLYALKPGMRVKDLVGTVIGTDNLLPEYYLDTIEITRLVPPDLHPEKIYVNLDRAIKGDEQDNILLNEFDNVRIFNRWEMEEVPKVRISGEVQKPGEYRLFSNMTLRDLILTSGNIKKAAFLGGAEITRSLISKDGVKSHIINVDLDEALNCNPTANILLENLDEVVVRRLPDWKEETERYITLRGEVRFPGVYPILKGEKLSSVLQRAGGYTEKAYLKAAKFTRKTVRELQQKRMDEVLARTEQDITRKQQELASVAASKEELEATKTTLQGMKDSLDKLKLAKAEGRISIRLSSVEELKDSPYDLELQGGDSLDIPQSTNSVLVFGEVYNPTIVIQLPGKELPFYLKKAGGPTQNAEEDEMYVIRADGSVESRQTNKGFLSFGGFMTMELDPGDTIVVPQKLEKVAWMRDLKDIAFILGQLALTAGVALAAGAL